MLIFSVSQPANPKGQNSTHQGRYTNRLPISIAPTKSQPAPRGRPQRIPEPECKGDSLREFSRLELRTRLLEIHFLGEAFQGKKSSIANIVFCLAVPRLFWCDFRRPRPFAFSNLEVGGEADCQMALFWTPEAGLGPKLRAFAPADYLRRR